MSIIQEGVKAFKSNSDNLLARCDYFVDVQLWPVYSKLNPKYWLENFTSEETPYAIQLLNSFLYFSDLLIDQLQIAAFHNLSNLIQLPHTYCEARKQWNTFLLNMLATHVPGEMPNETDSGYIFTRKARQVLEIDQPRILTIESAIDELNSGSNILVFFDDFVGSGNQFVTAWHKPQKLSNGESISFSQLAQNPQKKFYYCPLVCTCNGYKEIMSSCNSNSLTISPAYMISEQYNVFDTNSLVWPSELKSGAEEFIRCASMRAGIPDNDNLPCHWRGYNNQGLTLAFENSVPDATIPLFYWEQNGWKPLIRRK